MTLDLPSKVGVVGCDEMTAGWAARFLAQGLAVVVLLADEAEAAQLQRGIDDAWPILLKLGLMPGASREKLRVVNSVRALADLPFVLYGADAVVADELSFVKRLFARGEAFFVHHGAWVAVRGHVPVYLSPLVALWGEDVAAVAATAEFCRQLSMQPLIGSSDVVARLQTAVQQEAAKLQQAGVSEAAIEAALQLGLGLDWAMAGAETAVRDEVLLALMRTLRQFEVGAGKIIAAYDARRYTSIERPRWQPGVAVPAPLRLYRCDVDASWIDYNGHMTESSYLAAFGDASDALFRYIGIDEQYRASGNSYYTVETHINYYQECGGGDRLVFATQVLDFDGKRLHFFHEMYKEATAELVGTTEQMLLHVDTDAARAVVAKEHVLAALTAVLASHKQLPIPRQIGRQMRIQRK